MEYDSALEIEIEFSNNDSSCRGIQNIPRKFPVTRRVDTACRHSARVITHTARPGNLHGGSVLVPTQDAYQRGSLFLNREAEIKISASGGE